METSKNEYSLIELLKTKGIKDCNEEVLYKKDLDIVSELLIKKQGPVNISDAIDRLDSMGRSVLRIGIYEMKYTDTPDLVVINEAVELAKKYSDDAVRKMINAVLDKLINEE